MSSDVLQTMIVTEGGSGTDESTYTSAQARDLSQRLWCSFFNV